MEKEKRLAHLVDIFEPPVFIYLTHPLTEHLLFGFVKQIHFSGLFGRTYN